MRLHRSYLASLLMTVITVAASLTFQPVSPVLAGAKSEPVQPGRTEPRPLMAAMASVSLGLPGSVMLGENFSFTVTFDNMGDAPGYGPFIDLIFPVTGMDGDDGIDFVSATYLGLAVESNVQTFPASGCVSHPWVRDNTGTLVQVCGTPGDKLVSLRLPFGSFVPDQPPMDVTVNASLSNLADLSSNLTIRARGGYMFGQNPLDDWCCGDLPIVSSSDTNSSNWPGSPLTPEVMTFSKSYEGPGNTQDETATGPNFPEKYILTVDIAAGQTLTNLHITDLLPDNVQYIGIDAAGTTPGYSIINPAPGTSTPGGTLTLQYASVTGTAASNDITITVDFYIPRLDSGGGEVISSASGDDVNSLNKAEATASWTALDPRDGNTPVSSGGVCLTCPPLHTLQDKSIAIQKSVANITDSQYSPGDVLQYTLQFQVSDYFTFGGLVITDVISDGQHFDGAACTPSFTVTDRVETRVGNFSFVESDTPPDPPTSPTNMTINTSQITNTGTTDGTTTLKFYVSQAMLNNGAADGILQGGRAVAPDAGGAVGTVTYCTHILENFTDKYPSTDSSVDQGDVLSNTAVIAGSVLDNATFTPLAPEDDDAAAGISIGRDELSKMVYAINDDTNLTNYIVGGKLTIKPDDKVTFRLNYGLTTSDVENLTFDDYFSLPIFDVSDPGQTGGGGWSFNPVVGIPAPGVVQLGPSDSFYHYMDGNGTTGILSANPLNTVPTQAPVITADAAANKIVIAYADYDDTRDTPTTVDLLISLVVSSEPFADQLFLTNQAHAYEGSTNGVPSTFNSIIQFVMTEPVLVTTKSTVWAGSWNSVTWDVQPNATITPATTPAFNSPSNSPRWAGTITDGTTLDSDITGVDAGDVVTFAITLTNQGHSANGAFDIVIQDTLINSIFATPDVTHPLNLQIYLGDGGGVDYDGNGSSEPIQFTGLGGGPAGLADSSDDIFGNGIKLTDPADTLPTGTAVCQGHTIGAGKNVVVITYDLYVKDGVVPGSYPNTAVNTSYAGKNDGPNHVPTPGPGESYPSDVTDTANTTVVAPLEKQLVDTEIDNSTTTNTNDKTQVVIGELVTYSLTTTVPEGSVPGAFVTDHLDAGLAFVSCTSVTPSSANVTTDLASGSDFSGACGDVVVTNNGQDMHFNLGNVTNANRENTTAEQVVITYQAVVLNVSSNQSGPVTLLNNSAEFFMNNGSDVSLGTASAPTVTVIEPNVNITKSVDLPDGSPADAGDPVTYTIMLAGATSTDAYDLTLTDTLPQCSTGASAIIGTGVNPPTLVVTDSDSVVNATFFEWAGDAATGWTLRTIAGPPAVTFDMLRSATRTITIEVGGTIAYCVNPGQTLTNNAIVKWTSLDGDYTSTPRSTYNSQSIERTGAGGVNDYSKTGTRGLPINTSSSSKSLVSTSETFTSDVTNPPEVAIGEIVRYRLVQPIPEGTSPNFQVHDYLPTGLIYLEDNTTTVGFVFDNQVNSAPVGTLPVPATDPAGCRIADTNAALTCILADENVGSNTSTGSDPDSYGTSADPIFKIGNLTNNDSDASVEYVVIEFNALVDNTVSTGYNNQAGDTLVNFAATFINGSRSGNFSADVTVKVLEPALNPVKTATPASGDAGDTISYVLVISNEMANGVDNTDNTIAYDVQLTDTVPGKMTGHLGSMTLDNPGTCAVGMSNTSLNNDVNISFTSMPVGCTVTVTYTATLNETVTPEEIIDNNVHVVYSSLPGPNGTTSNPTGSATPGATGATNGERSYDNTASDSVTVPAVNIEKRLNITSATHTIGADVAIGEEVTYDILLTFPEGTTAADTVVDDLPIGLMVVAGTPQVITQSSASGGSLTADFNGTIGSQNITVVSGDGGSVTFEFTNVVVTGDNDTTNNTLLLRFRAQVTDVTANIAGQVISNEASNRVNGGTPVTSTPPVDVTVVEPIITFSKAIIPPLPSPLDAGGVVHYRITYANAADTGTNHVSTAMDVQITDSLASALLLASVSAPDVVITTTANVGVVTNNSSTSKIDISIASVPPGESITVDFYPVIQDTITPGQVVDNIGDAAWTSLGGTVIGERDGTDGPTGSPDNYAATDSDSFTSALSPVTIEKNLYATSAAHTTGSNVTIGEIVTYDILLTFPEGATAADQVVDNLPNGLLVVGSPQVIRLVVDSGGSLAADFNGTIGTQNITVAADNKSLTFDFANVVVVGDNDTTNNTLLLRFSARVTDDSTNVGFPTATSLSNSASNQVGSGTPTTTTPVVVTIVEPRPILTKSFANVTTPAMGASGIVGDVIRMTLTYQNTGTSNAYDVVITDALDDARVTNLTPVTTPAGFTYLTSGTGPVTVQYTADAGIAVAPGAILTFELDFTLTADNYPGDVIPNTANVTRTTTLDSSINDGDDANERNAITDASADLTFMGVDLSVTKNDGVTTTAQPGDLITYTFDLQNLGNLDATNVTLTETVPANTTYDSADNPLYTWDCGVTNPATAGTTCTLNLGTLAAGGTSAPAFIVTVDDPLPTNVDMLSNTASVTADQVETVTTNNTASDDTPVTATPTFVIVKDNHVSIVAPGKQYTYTITISNNGNQDAVNLALTDTLPAEVDYVTSSDSGSETGGVVAWPLFDLAAGFNTTRTVMVQVKSKTDLAGATSLTNTVHVEDDGTNNGGIPVVADDSDTDTIADSNVKSLVDTGEPDSGEPVSDKSIVYIGEPVIYEIQITIPPGTMGGLTATDILEPGLAFDECISVTPEADLSTNLPGGFDAACPAAAGDPNVTNTGHQVVFNFGDVINNSPTELRMLTVRYQAIVLDIAENIDGASGLNNSVTWIWDGGSLAGSAEGLEIIEPDLAIDKNATPTSALYGSTITFTIDIAHASTSTANAYDVVVTDVIPSGLQYVDGSAVITGLAATSVAYDAPSTTLAVTWDLFPLSQSATITFEAVFVGPSPVVNESNVAWSSLRIDPNLDGTPVQQSSYNAASTERWYDPRNPRGVNGYGVSSSVTINRSALPKTGFAPGRVTALPVQPEDKQYQQLGELTLEIPHLGVKLPIVGVPASTQGWDLTWLSNQAGWLEGTAYPTWTGNTGLTGHSYLADGTPGPFVNLSSLYWGDKVYIHANGDRYTYEVREVRLIWPQDVSVLRHEDYDWITLITCREYNEEKDDYTYRVVVRAVLVKVEPE